VLWCVVVCCVVMCCGVLCCVVMCCVVLCVVFPSRGDGWTHKLNKTMFEEWDDGQACVWLVEGVGKTARWSSCKVSLLFVHL
jgi:hypothetical protein